MCGIVGIYYKNPELESGLGGMLADMLVQMTDRGPDSAGVAIYHDPVSTQQVKITLQGQDDVDWAVMEKSIAEHYPHSVSISPVANHAVVILDVQSERDADRFSEWVTNSVQDINITSVGSAIEIFKEKGLPDQVVDKFSLRSMRGTHALGHTRMATESAVTTEHSHPFSTGLDLCLVHNGSLSNHNQLREMLRKQGIMFQTDNDSEVAAGYLTWRLSQGASLNEALEAAIQDLDGFYTFAIGTKDGFAVLRDPIACKPAVLAETDDWVAMSSEFRAIAQLPNSENARIWEPEPARIYSWERN
ncbi:MAG: glutamine amidotransferase family protein [Acidiferrobacterales bacterium]|nr:glutamine amidotransferase family protein [Acidiferrobacterales bacterium]